MSTDRGWIDAVVTARRPSANGIVELELAGKAGAALPAFSAGSHIDLEIAPGLVRQYSLANGTREPGRYVIAVLREPMSRGGSAAVHDRIHAADSIRISAPRNLFPLNADAERTFLYAGGIGITPLLCMAERLHGASQHYRLHYCAKSEDKAAFLARIQAGELAPNTQLHFSNGDDGQRFNLNRDLPAHQPGDHLYACGPAGFMSSILSGARDRGWPEEALHREYFVASDSLESDSDTSFTVRVASTGLDYEVPGGKTIVETLAAAGIEIEVSCEQGICGTCLTKILAGTADHRDMFLTEDEQARQDQLTPCCSRATSDLLVLDL